MITFYSMPALLLRAKTGKQMVKELPNCRGQSFLLNYEGLKKWYWKYHSTDIINYLVMASLRDYNHCKTFNDYTVERDLVTLNDGQLYLNKLIWVKNSKIYLKYEEEYGT